MSEDVGYSWDASLPIFMHCMIVIPGHTTRALFEDEERDDCDDDVDYRAKHGADGGQYRQHVWKFVAERLVVVVAHASYGESIDFE